MNNKNFDKQPFIGCLSSLKENLYLVIGILITISLTMYCILGVFGFSAFPDEFGYWSPAAAILGLDWSEITSLGAYYSYGYSALLVIVLFLFRGAISTYRAAIILNLLLQCISIPLIYNILKNVFPSVKKNGKSIAAVISVLYPAWVFYTQTTMAESLLYFLFILTAFLLMKFLEKPGVLRGLIFVLVLVYCYFVHMRCIGLIGAGVITVFIWLISKRKSEIGKKAWLIPLLIIALFAASFTIKSFVIDRLYHSTSDVVLAWNDYGSVPYRILKIFNLEGITYILEDLAGKLLYLGLATYGIGYFGIFSLIKHTFSSIKKAFQKKADKVDIIWIFLFLATLAQFMVALVYLNGASWPGANRLDNYLHGRYVDFFLPILIGVGICEMIEVSGLVFAIVSAACFVLYTGLYFVARYVISVNEGHMYNAHGFTMIGMSYLLPESPVENTLGFLLNETLLGAGLTLAVIFVILLYRRLKQETFLLLMVVIQIVLSMNAFSHHVFQNQNYIYGDILMGKKLKEVRLEYPEKSILHIYDGEVQYIELVQFEDREAKIKVINREFEDVDITPFLTPDKIVIIEEHCPDLERIEDTYDAIYGVAHLRMYYNK